MNLSPNDISLWRATKQLLCYQTKNLSLKNADDSFARSDTEKSELFQASPLPANSS